MPADPDLIAFRETFRLDDLTVAEDDHWVISVRPGQLTLGSMVLSSRSGLQDFAALDAAASAAMGAAMGAIERVARTELGAVRVNVVALMMKDPVVHFHCLPRYDQPVEAHGVTWQDRDWPGPPTFGPAPTDDEVLEALRDRLRAAW